MTEMILPGVSIEVRPEGLMIPGRISVGTLGVVGTASKGLVGKPVILGSYGEAREQFGEYDAFIDGKSDELTLVRALEQAFNHGATSVIALRVASASAAAADYTLSSSSGDCCSLAALSEGTWGNEIEVNIHDAEEHSFVSGEEHSGGGTVILTHKPVVESARNRISVFDDSEHRTRLLDIIYTGTPDSGQVALNITTGALTFHTGEAPAAADKVTASYLVNASASVKVSLRLGTTEEVYTVASGEDLVADIAEHSTLVEAKGLAHADELPDKSADAETFNFFGTGSNTRGANGAAGADYSDGLDKLVHEPAHIMIAAGRHHSDIGADLAAHCKLASSDLNKGERIGVVGSGPDDTLDSILGHNMNSDRIVFVAPGIVATDAPTRKKVTLPGAYAAAAVAGLISSYSAHISLTNKVLPVQGLEKKHTPAELTRLVQARVLALEERQGFRVVKGITSSTVTAWAQITTRRVVDFAKYGVRSAALPYIGRLNNERVRGALHSTINSFLTEMVEDEKLVGYELEVSATREEERKGVVRVTIVLRPTFSIDYIKVTMFLE